MRLFGKNPVIERIRSNPATIKELYLQRGVDLSVVVQECKKKNIKFESVDKDWFKKNGCGLHSQGVLAEVKDFKYLPFKKILAKCLKAETIPLFLDGVTDPQNLGSIIRTLACMGRFSLVIPEHNSADVNETVLRVASGGENYIDISMVTNSATILSHMKRDNVMLAGAVVEASEPVSKAELRIPLALVVGAEGKGIRPGILKLLDARLSLPMEGADLSYNVSVATALFCHEVKRRLYVG